jgi:hypothetical protein
MSKEYYNVSEYLPYQVDVAVPDQALDVALPETSDFDSFKDSLEKLIGLELSDPEDQTVSEPHEKTQTLIYRFSLPFDTSIAEYQLFEKNIEWIKNKNPKWEVIPDMPKLGEESEAWIMVYKDENYLNSRISYLINSSISRSLI